MPVVPWSGLPVATKAVGPLESITGWSATNYQQADLAQRPKPRPKARRHLQARGQFSHGDKIVTAVILVQPVNARLI